MIFVVFLPLFINQTYLINTKLLGVTIAGYVYDDYDYPIKNAHVKLYVGIGSINEQYEFIDSTDTDSNGYYYFIDPQTPSNSAQFFLEVSTDSSSSVICMGEFRELLGPDPTYWDTDFILMPKDGICTFRGYAWEIPGYKPIRYTNVKLVSKYGKIITETFTNYFGYYQFSNIPYQGDYVQIKVYYYPSDYLLIKTKTVYPIDGGTITTNFYIRVFE
ncbi:MAG: hypothetical protein ACTSXD_00705 [Candidatus Heimdallarchaeaceae archaeon]